MDHISKDADYTPGALRLSYGINFEDLYDHAGLARIDVAFFSHLAACDPGLAEKLRAARASQTNWTEKRNQSFSLMFLHTWMISWLSYLI
mgnify:CR=1 FL=1